jgi:hypothetical protein
MDDETKKLLWQASKEGDTEALERVISKCKAENFPINEGNPERFGATAIHYGVPLSPFTSAVSCGIRTD